MQDRETALKNALRELTAIVRGECPSLLNEDSGGNGELSYEIDTLLASPLSAPPQEPTGASPQAEELRAANVANLREMVGMAGRHRETLLAVRECILALSPGHRTGYDWNADPLFLTLKEGRALNLIDDALKATPASPQAEPSRCAETCGLLRCRLNEGHSGLHQVYNAATGDFQQFIGQLAPVSPVEPAGSPTTAHVAPIVGKVWTHHDGVLPDGSVCRTADVDALIAERTAQLQAALFDEQASHEATKCRLVAAEQSHEAAGNRVIELLKSTPVEPAGAAPEGREHPMTERAKKVATLEITLRARYDVQTGRMVGLGVETPNAQGWHPRVTGSYMSTADRVFPAKLPRAAARIAKKG